MKTAYETVLEIAVALPNVAKDELYETTSALWQELLDAADRPNVDKVVVCWLAEAVGAFLVAQLASVGEAALARRLRTVGNIGAIGLKRLRQPVAG